MGRVPNLSDCAECAQPANTHGRVGGADDLRSVDNRRLHTEGEGLPVNAASRKDYQCFRAAPTGPANVESLEDLSAKY